MTRGTGCEARTQGASICRHIGATEDAASRPVTPVRRPGPLSGQAPSATIEGVMPGWVIWAILAVLLALGELATPGLFFLGPVALAAIPAGIVALIGGAAWLQVLVFILGSLATLGIVRPIARAHLQMPALMRTGTAALVGARALVLERVDQNGGRVRIGGEEWSARAYMDDQVIEPGARVEVAKIEGATALVYE